MEAAPSLKMSFDYNKLKDPGYFAENRVAAHSDHAFYADLEAKTIRFDVVLSFDIEPGEALAVLSREMQEAYPDYTTQIVPEVDISD